MNVASLGRLAIGGRLRPRRRRVRDQFLGGIVDIRGGLRAPGATPAGTMVTAAAHRVKREACELRKDTVVSRLVGRYGKIYELWEGRCLDGVPRDRESGSCIRTGEHKRAISHYLVLVCRSRGVAQRKRQLPSFIYQISWI